MKDKIRDIEGNLISIHDIIFIPEPNSLDDGWSFEFTSRVIGIDYDSLDIIFDDNDGNVYTIKSSRLLKFV